MFLSPAPRSANAPDLALQEHAISPADQRALSMVALFPLQHMTRSVAPKTNAYTLLKIDSVDRLVMSSIYGTVAPLSHKRTDTGPQIKEHLPDEIRPDETLISSLGIEMAEKVERRIVHRLETLPPASKEAPSLDEGADETAAFLSKKGPKGIGGRRLSMPIPRPGASSEKAFVPEGYKYLGKGGWLALSMN